MKTHMPPWGKTVYEKVLFDIIHRALLKVLGKAMGLDGVSEEKGRFSMGVRVDWMGLPMGSGRGSPPYAPMG